MQSLKSPGRWLRRLALQLLDHRLVLLGGDVVERRVADAVDAVLEEADLHIRTVERRTAGQQHGGQTTHFKRILVGYFVHHHRVVQDHVQEEVPHGGVAVPLGLHSFL